MTFFKYPSAFKSRFLALDKRKKFGPPSDFLSFLPHQFFDRVPLAVFMPFSVSYGLAEWGKGRVRGSAGRWTLFDEWAVFLVSLVAKG